jgi:hypothetical protein
MDDIKPMLQRRCGELVRELVPGARREGDHWVAPNPRRGETKGGSFIVWARAGGEGAWKEFDAGDAEKGDIVDLIIYTGQAEDRKGALAWAKRWLGLEGAPPEEIVRLREAAKEQAEKADAAEIARRASMARLAKKLWLEGAPLAPKTAAWIYLQDARGIPLHRLLAKGKLGALRFDPRVTYVWPEAKETPLAWQAMRPRSGKSFHPALLALMTPIAGGEACGLHRTFLAHDGLSKARVIKAKKMIGQQLGCAINLWRGESGLPPRAAAEKKFKGPCAVTEGIENGLSIAAARPDLRVWAMGSLAGIGSLEWHPCVSEFVIFGDNDPETLPDGRPHPARAALREAAARLAQNGPVKLAFAHQGKDANDLLNA